MFLKKNFGVRKMADKKNFVAYTTELKKLMTVKGTSPAQAARKVAREHGDNVNEIILREKGTKQDGQVRVKRFNISREPTEVKATMEWMLAKDNVVERDGVKYCTIMSGCAKYITGSIEMIDASKLEM